MPLARRSLSLAIGFLVVSLAILPWPRDAEADFAIGSVNGRSLAVGANTYLYDVYVPQSYTGDTPVPLVVDYHGLLSDKTGQRLISGFKEQADEKGFIVAYPLGLYGNVDACPFGNKAYLTDSITPQPSAECASGDPASDPIEELGPSWHAGPLCCGKAKTESADDVGFSRALVEAIAGEGNIDTDRVYATGLSNGGALAHALACEAADVFAAVATVAFPIPYPDPDSQCKPSRPIAVIQYAGTQDTVVPSDGGATKFGAFVPSAEDSFNRWREINRCSMDPPTQTPETPDETVPQCQTSQCNGVEVALCDVNSTSPGPDTEGHILYQDNGLTLPLAEHAWDFLKQFKIEQEPEPEPEPEPPPPLPRAARRLYMGTTPNVNAGIVSDNPGHLGGTGSLLGCSAKAHPLNQSQLYRGTANQNAGFISSLSNFRDSATMPWGFSMQDGVHRLHAVDTCENPKSIGAITVTPNPWGCHSNPIGYVIPPGLLGCTRPMPVAEVARKLYYGITPNVNAGIVSDNPGHLGGDGKLLGCSAKANPQTHKRLYRGIGHTNAGFISPLSEYRGSETMEWGYSMHFGTVPLYEAIQCDRLWGAGAITVTPQPWGCPSVHIGYVISPGQPGCTP